MALSSCTKNTLTASPQPSARTLFCPLPISRATGMSSTAEIAMYTNTLSASGVLLFASFITKAWTPQQMNTMEAKRIQIRLVAAPSLLSGKAKQTRATNASAMPRMPSLETFSLRTVADSSTVTMGATEIIGITR